jgi:hypothetical protein
VLTFFIGHRSTVALVEHMRKKTTREENIYDAKQRRIGKKLKKDLRYEMTK